MNMKKQILTLLKRYRVFLVVSAAFFVLTLFNYNLGMNALIHSGNQFLQMLLIIPPVFILLGLLDVWVPRETMMKYMGEDSGLKGILLAFLIGSVAAGPLYGAFPVAAVLMKKGVKFCNILIFIGAWSTTKIPQILFEISALGAKFAVTRLLIDIPGILIIALLLSRFTPENAVKKIYEDAKKMDN